MGGVCPYLELFQSIVQKLYKGRLTVGTLEFEQAYCVHPHQCLHSHKVFRFLNCSTAHKIQLSQGGCAGVGVRERDEVPEAFEKSDSTAVTVDWSAASGERLLRRLV